MERLWIALSSWKIEDGNFRDFRAGQRVRLALSAAVQTVRLGRGDGRRLERLRDAWYRFDGRVAHRAEDAWVLDLGLPVFVEGIPPSHAATGSWCSGELVLSVAPYFYFAGYSRRPGALPLVCRWKIDRVMRIVTPLTAETDEMGTRVAGPVEQRQEFVEVGATDVQAHRGRGYLVECTRLSGPSSERFDALSPEDQSAIGALVGQRVSVQIGADPGGTPQHAAVPLAARVLQIEGQELREQMGLLRLDLPFVHAGKPYQHMVAYPRYEGEGFGQVAIEGSLFCSLKWLSADQAGATPFDHKQWPSGPGLAALVRSSPPVE